MVQGSVYSAQILFSVNKPIPLAVWSGMYLHKLILQVLESSGLSLSHRDPKPFSISPIYIISNTKIQHFIDKGILNPGQLYTFRFSSLERKIFECVVKGFAHVEVDIFNVVRIEQARLTIPTNINCVEDSDKSSLIILVRFSPTIFKFHGHAILYPSPIRFMKSLMKYLHIATSLDVSKCFGDLTRAADLINFDIRVNRFSIGRDDSNRDRIVKAFYGSAKYVIVVPKSFANVFKNYVLRFVKVMGIGKNRSIGFGDISEISILSDATSNNVEKL